MAGKVQFWTPGRLEEAKQAVITGRRGNHTVVQIARRLSQIWGREVSAAALNAVIVTRLEFDEPPQETKRDTLPELFPADAIAAEEEEDGETVSSLQEEHEERSEVAQLRAAKKMLLEELRAKESQIRVLSELRASRPFEPISSAHKVGGHQRSGVPVMVLSDLHIEERVDPEKTNGINKYNPEIAAECFEAATDSFIWLHQDARYDCRTGVIAIIGDTFSNYIHAELQETNFLSPVQAVVWLQEHFERMLRRIAAETTFERIIVLCKDGNHGRMTQKMRASTRTENSLEWLMFKTLAARLVDEPRFEFIIEDGIFTYLDVYNTSLCFAHGDIWRSAGGVGGITIPLRKGFNEIKKRPHKLDHLVIGHFHQRLDTGEIIVNGSMIGATPWSLANCFSPEPRQQTWFLIDSERGKCLSAPVWLPQYRP